MSNPVAQLALTAALGETRTFRGTHQTSSTDTTPINITGFTITVTIKKGATTITKSGTVTSGTLGTYTWPIAAADTVSLAIGDGAIDIWRTDAGSETLMAIGTFSILADVRV